MKYKLMCLTFLFVMLLISIKPNANNSGIETESYPEEKKSNLINRLNICVLEEEPDRRPIDCFAMNKNGVIALGCSRGSSKKSICFYTQEGIFIYGVLFVCQGSFCIELNGDLLIIYFVRDNVAVSVNPNGEVVDIVAIKKTVENNKYKNRLLGQSKFKEGNTEVILKNDMGFFNLFAWNYSQLIIKSNEGEQILYDVNSSQFKKIVNLHILSLSYSSINRIQQLSNLSSLEILEIDHCPRICDWDAFQSSSLKILLMLGNNRIDSIDFIVNLPNLKALVFEGTIGNGDIKSLKRLERCALTPHKRFYNVSQKELAYPQNYKTSLDVSDDVNWFSHWSKPKSDNC